MEYYDYTNYVLAVMGVGLAFWLGILWKQVDAE